MKNRGQSRLPTQAGHKPQGTIAVYRTGIAGFTMAIYKTMRKNLGLVTSCQPRSHNQADVPCTLDPKPVRTYPKCDGTTECSFQWKTNDVFIIIWRNLVSPASAALLLGDAQERWININAIHNTNIQVISDGITNTAGCTQKLYIIMRIVLFG